MQKDGLILYGYKIIKIITKLMDLKLTKNDYIYGGVYYILMLIVFYIT